jgi:RHS repeat-associated protein
VTSTYVYDALDVVQEKNADSQLKAMYIFGALDEPMQRIAPRGTGWAIDTYMADHLGSILELRDIDASTVVSYSYDAYGNSRGSVYDNNPYQFTGRENDGHGLYYYRARYYSPSMHRFLQSDPIGLVGGINEYEVPSGFHLPTIRLYAAC